jgi:peptidoglycan/xylan/chitin deacetylase (PgdA/CDA1 family)
MTQSNLNWPDGKRIAVIFNVCLEGWSDGKAPGISPMGNPLPPTPGLVDTMANSWAAYGMKRGIFRLLDSFKKFDAKASVMVNGVIAERAPESIRACVAGGHEIMGHSYAMDVIPLLLTEEAERANIKRTTSLLEEVAGTKVRGWLSPRGTPSVRSAQLLAEAGYQHFGDVFDDDLPYTQAFGDKSIVCIPFGTDVNDMPFIKFGSEPAAMLESFRQNLDIARKTGESTIIDVTSHAHIFGHPRGAYYHERIIEAALECRDVWVCTRSEIADRHVAANR